MLMRRRFTELVFAAILAMVAAVSAGGSPAFAQQAAPMTAGAAGSAQQPEAGRDTQGDKRGFFARKPEASPMPSASSGGPLTALWIWMQATQQRLHQSLAGAVRDLKTRDPFAAAMALITVSFLYGVFHAAGPGHGKAVISSYVLANERTVRRGIFLSFLAAGVQGLSALVLVAVLALLLNATGMTIKATERWIETLSWALVALVGAWLLYGQVKAVLAERARRRATEAAAQAVQLDLGRHHHHRHDHAQGACGCSHDHPTGHAHGHEHSHARDGDVALIRRVTVASATTLAARASVPSTATSIPPVAPAVATATSTCTHAHEPGHEHDGHDHSACCGHAHMPAPDQLDGDLTWSKALAIAFSVGIRPCTGAILVLLFALSQGMLWAGVLSTFAMAVGTAITVSALAALAVGSRELAKRLAGGEASRWGWRVERVAGFTGALLVMSLGTAFFFASLQPQAPF